MASDSVRRSFANVSARVARTACQTLTVVATISTTAIKPATAKAVRFRCHAFCSL